MVFKQLDKFFHRFQRYFFKYKDGFYEVPYLANSPQMILESFKKVPFMKWDESRKLLSMKNHFLVGNIHWMELEEGLWFILADTTYKVNLHYKFIYDKYLPANYYLISLNKFNQKANAKSAVVNGLSFQSFSWNVIKPRGGASVSNFKNTECTSMGFYFSREWAEQNLNNDPAFKQSKFQSFFNSRKCPVIIWPDKEAEKGFFFDKARILAERAESEEKTKALKNLGTEFIQYFTNCYDIEHTNEGFNEIKSDTQLKLAKIEKILSDHLLEEFPGIDFLADKFGMSPTKLKNDFKQIYGQSIYQYYLGKQMDLAKMLIVEKHMKIGEVSNLLGYKNDSKFTEAFKNRHHVVPSKIASVVEPCTTELV